MSIRLYVGNLPKELDRKELETLFAAEVGELGSTKVVTDRKTGKCRGFGFVTVETDELADQVIEKFNGHLFKDSPLKIEKALPRAKGKEDEAKSAEASEPVTASGGGARRNSKNRSSRRGGSSVSSGNHSDEVQPDPRWAQELEKLKQMLSAQASSS
jgi:RNA recognition motif-containing protein